MPDFADFMAIKRIYKAKTDAEFLDQLAFIIFVAGFRYSLVEERWPAITKLFDKFNIGKVGGYGEKDIERLISGKGMIRNRQKIGAVIENAKMLMQIKAEYGSVRGWLEDIRKNSKEGIFHRTPLEEEFRQFRRIGKVTSGWLAGIYRQEEEYVEYDPEAE